MLFYTALIVYASLYPFSGWRNQGLLPGSFLWAPWPRYWTWFDLVTNLAGYFPLGVLLTLALSRRWSAELAMMGALGTAVLLSFSMESLQTLLPLRVSSNVDFGLNAAGALTGAAVAVFLERSGLSHSLRRLSWRWFRPGSRYLLTLLFLWPVALLYPTSIPFGLGQVFEAVERVLLDLLSGTPLMGWLPVRQFELQPLLPHAEQMCVALGLLAPCLLGFMGVRSALHRLVLSGLTCLAALTVLSLSTALAYGPSHTLFWLTPVAVLALPAALMLAAILAVFPLSARSYGVLLVLVLALQLWLLNSAPPNAYMAPALETWERGRFVHFFGLTRWLNGLWPFATLAYGIAALAVRKRARADAT